VGIDKITIKGPLQWGFNGWTFYSFTQTVTFFFKLSRIILTTIYYQYICPEKHVVLKKVNPPSLSTGGHV
jgi:hypothetical protein